MILRARLVLPISQNPIQDGAVAISRGRIVAVGRWRALKSSVRGRVSDLGEVILMPGLVNAHCHLDYTDFAGQFPPPKLFTDWIKLIVTAKSQCSLPDYAGAWKRGAEMLLRTGTTTVADIEAVPELLPSAWGSTPLRVFSFLELIAITGRRKPAVLLDEALGRVKKLKNKRSFIGLSPHAPYSTGPELLHLSAEAARERGLRLCVHVAESAVEYEMFKRGRGEMFRWLKRGSRDMADCGLRTPMEHLGNSGALGQNLLAVHANYLGRNDPTLLGTSGTHVVHCPRSHHYFRHRKFPLRKLLKARVNVCLGTDSLASVYKKRRQTLELSMFDEMRALADAQSFVRPQGIVQMATVNGATALGMQGAIGELRPGAYADVIAIPFSGAARNLYSAVLQHQGKVSASMIGGEWAIKPTSKSGTA
ncbi:MAG TPA: amidohydrolase family protein [Candidatus Dormibacteraeota bacterium]|nr:amidohydrolase family protein [Candidatus Dormibacteraeota bacterium]